MSSRIRPIPVIEHGPHGLSVTMRAPRAAVLVVFLGVWLTMWTFGGVSAMRALASFDSLFNPISLFLLLWLAGWIVGEVGVAFAIVFMLAGAEIVTLDGTRLSQRAEAFGWGITRRYDLDHTVNLRTVSGDGDSEPRTLLAFDYADKTVRFGTNLQETEAAEICEAMRSFEPRLARAAT